MVTVKEEQEDAVMKKPSRRTAWDWTLPLAHHGHSQGGAGGCRDEEAEQKDSHEEKRKEGNHCAWAVQQSDVFNGKKLKTVGGLRVCDMMRNRYGKIVSKRASARAKLNIWSKAISAARRALGITGWVNINQGPKGVAIYQKAKMLVASLKREKE
eukprot:CAMPEP_0175773102 /NCGR_PEP_ID=MMETSP0097-20121207/72910_1 /TAXON_ID=311494 /ORGANISM="Alexandrium monilatum, Strain CCMP3105" /LENGTH=154 /DNA_ID=CAMNT_0017083513 /DNA_START=57 /DNA_END=522 /DNA_ORIENTATION=-